MKRIFTFVWFLFLSSTAAFAAGNREAMPQQALQKILTGVKKCDKAIIESIYGEIPNGREIFAENLLECEEMMKFFDFKLRGNEIRMIQDKDGEKTIFIGIVTVTNRDFFEFLNSFMQQIYERESDDPVFSSMDAFFEVFEQAMKEYCQEDAPALKSVQTARLPLIQTEKGWKPYLDESKDNFWYSIFAPVIMGASEIEMLSNTTDIFALMNEAETIDEILQ